jgi:hypothetical protein
MLDGKKKWPLSRCRQFAPWKNSLLSLTRKPFEPKGQSGPLEQGIKLLPLLEAYSRVDIYELINNIYVDPKMSISIFNILEKL